MRCSGDAQLASIVMISLATPRTVLRPWVDADLAWFCDLSADPEVMQYIGGGLPRSTSDATESFVRLRADWNRNGFGLLAIECLDGGHVVGFAGLGRPSFLPEIMPSVEIGWRLSPSAWGRGFATEAAAAVLDWAFTSLDLPQVVAVIHVENERSRRLAEKLGFTPERRTIVPEHEVWADVYRLDQTAWSGGPVADGSSIGQVL